MRVSSHADDDSGNDLVMTRDQERTFVETWVEDPLKHLVDKYISIEHNIRRVIDDR